MKHTLKDLNFAREFLNNLPKNDRGKIDIAVNITHVSKSGMQRRMRFYVNGFVNITWHIAVILDKSMDDRGLKVDGCGMDMCFHVLSSLNYKMATLNTNRTLSALLDDPAKPCGERIYDDYMFDANHYKTL